MVEAKIDISATPQVGRNSSFFALVRKRFFKHKPAVIGLIVLLILVFMAALAPLIAPYPPGAQDLALIGQPQPPSTKHLMGTDQLGRDSFSRVVYGARVSLSVGLLSALIAAIIGTLIGSLAGFYGGQADMVLMRFTDVVLSIPILPLVILLAGLFRADVLLIVIIIGCLGWMSTARLVRGQFLSLKQTDYVEASKALGSPSRRTMFRHILPNAFGPIVVAATLTVGNAIMLAAALSFLGLGVHPPTPTWGNLLNGAQAYLSTAPWLAFFPGLFILIAVLAVNFLGDGLRDALDPRS
jgi:peptide/nickel transport system permease protein